MGVVAKVVENVVKPVVMQALLAWERLESGVGYNPIAKANRQIFLYVYTAHPGSPLP